MATIKERAKEYCLDNCNSSVKQASHALVAYVAGATEQREIDVDKACSCFCKVCGYKKKKCEDDWRCAAWADFRKSMEEEI